MPFIIYDTTGLIFDKNVSTTIDNVDSDTIIYKPKYRSTDPKKPDINTNVQVWCNYNYLDVKTHDITIYANTGDVVYNKGYNKGYTKRFIDHIISKQPDVLICDDFLFPYEIINSPLTIKCNHSNYFTVNDVEHSFDFDYDRCDEYKKYADSKEDLCSDDEFAHSYKCSVRTDDLLISTLRKKVVKCINEYMSKNTPNTDKANYVNLNSTFTQFLSNANKAILEQLEIDYLHDNVYSYKDCNSCEPIS